MPSRLLVALAAVLMLAGLDRRSDGAARSPVKACRSSTWTSTARRWVATSGCSRAGGATAPTSGSGGATAPTRAPEARRRRHRAPGAKAVYLLDGLRAQDDYSGWDINTAAFEWFHGSGVSVVMPVGGQSSFYTDWYSPSSFNNQAFTYKWETFLTQELPAWLAANKQISATGNGVVGLSMSGGSALILSAYHPAQFSLRGLAFGLPEPVGPAHGAGDPRRDAGLRQLQRRQHVGSAVGRRVETQRPVKQVDRIVANGTRLWVYCAPGLIAGSPAGGATPLDEGAVPNQAFNADSLEGMAFESNKAFQAAYVKAGGSNATFQFPAAGNHAWPYWGAQLQALKPDLIATLNG